MLHAGGDNSDGKRAYSNQGRRRRVGGCLREANAKNENLRSAPIIWNVKNKFEMIFVWQIPKIA